MNSAIKGQFYKRIISNSSVKFHGKKNLGAQRDCVVFKSVL